MVNSPYSIRHLDPPPYAANSHTPTPHPPSIHNCKDLHIQTLTTPPLYPIPFYPPTSDRICMRMMITTNRLVIPNYSSASILILIPNIPYSPSPHNPNPNLQCQDLHENDDYTSNVINDVILLLTTNKVESLTLNALSDVVSTIKMCKCDSEEYDGFIFIKTI